MSGAERANRKKIGEKDAQHQAALRSIQRDEKALAEAVWESNLPVKDGAAQQKRFEKNQLAEAKESGELIKRVRMRKLEELYKRDTEIYENELAGHGMAFTKSDI